MHCGFAIRSRISREGFGVVVMMHRGSEPTRRPNCSWSHASGNLHAASSSHQAVSCSGPRSISGISAEYVVAVAPVWNVTRLFEGSYSGLWSGGNTASSPLRPSIITSRQSAAVLPTIAILLCPASTLDRIHSAPVLVLPQPLPAFTSQYRQREEGGSWLGLAQNSHE